MTRLVDTDTLNPRILPGFLARRLQATQVSLPPIGTLQEASFRIESKELDEGEILNAIGAFFHQHPWRHLREQKTKPTIKAGIYISTAIVGAIAVRQGEDNPTHLTVNTHPFPFTREWATVIDQFRNNIYYDAHNYATKVGRSMARGFLRQLGLKTLVGIVDNITTSGLLGPVKTESLDDEMRHAWMGLFDDLAHDYGLEGTTPPDYKDFGAWVEWAKKYQTPTVV